MTKIVAHRGFSKHYPENTMLAFRKAVETGCEGIELDVQLTADGIPVVIHDEKVDRTTNGEGLVRSFTLAELQKLDAHGAFTGKYECQPVPTLEEYFAYMQDKPQFTNIELKNSIFVYPQLEEKVVALIHKYKLEARVCFSSFNHYSMVRCKELAPAIPTGLLTSCWIVDAGAYGKAVGADYINGGYPGLLPWVVEEIQQNGLNCNAWTVDEEDEMRRLAALKVESIITNCPDLAMLVLRG